MIIFDNDEKGYLTWVEENPEGFVVNTLKTPSRSYLVLHKATCGTIKTLKKGNFTTGQYIKVCALDASELEKWAREEVGGILDACQLCKP